MPVDSQVSIVDLQRSDTDLVSQIVKLLEACFMPFAPDWLPSDITRQQEVQKSLAEGRRSRVLLKFTSHSRRMGRCH